MIKQTRQPSLKRGVCYCVVPSSKGVTREQVDAFMLENVEACQSCRIREHCEMTEWRRTAKTLKTRPTAESLLVRPE